MKIKRLSSSAQLPQKAHRGDLGYELFCSEETVVWPSETKLVPTGIAVQFPDGYGAFLRDRSSVATKLHLFTVAGIIDNGYIGEIKVAFYNGGENARRILVGEKIAQMVLIPTVNFSVEEVDEITSADARGDNGFGSTGR
jgi:dUTP pyrophosphatase